MKVKFHYSLIFILFLCFFTRLFLEFLIFIVIIILHELGHILMALCFQRKIKKITITALGGIVDVDFYGLNAFKEFLINISGIVINIILYLIFKYFIFFSYSKLIIDYNTLLIIFNLLPIYPLDGYRILNNIIMIFSNFHFRFKIMMWTSSITLTIYLLYSIINFSLSFLIVGVLLIHKNVFVVVNKDYFLLQHIMNFNIYKGGVKC